MTDDGSLKNKILGGFILNCKWFCCGIAGKNQCCHHCNNLKSCNETGKACLNHPTRCNGTAKGEYKSSESMKLAKGRGDL